MFHRVDDMESMPADRWWSYVERLAFYGGVVAARFRYQHQTAEPREPAAAPQIDGPMVTADNADAILANPLYGEVPGLGAVFTHATVP